MMKSRADAEEHFIDKVRIERSRQNSLWGEQTHSGHAWCGIILEEAGEFAKEINESNTIEAEEELVQIAACCMAAYAQSVADQALLPDFGDFKGKEASVSSDESKLAYIGEVMKEYILENFSKQE